MRVRPLVTGASPARAGRKVDVEQRPGPGQAKIVWVGTEYSSRQAWDSANTVIGSIKTSRVAWTRTTLHSGIPFIRATVTSSCPSSFIMEQRAMRPMRTIET